MAGFTPKMSAALTYFAKHRNKAAAYRYAYNTENMLPTTVQRNAFDLFEHKLMAAAVQQMEAVAATTRGIDAAWVLERAARLADFNINRFIVTDELGAAVYDFSCATDDDWYCISEYTVDMITKGAQHDRYEVERVKLKSHCKLRALELCGKHAQVRAFTEHVEHTGEVTVVQMTATEYKAARAEALLDDDC